MWEILLSNALILGVAVTALWLLSVARRDASIVDIFWGMGFVIIAWMSYVRGARSPHGFLLAALISIWGVRLALYLAMRNLGKGEDYRYQEMRAKTGSGFWWKSYFIVFLLQAGLMLVVSLPIQAVAARGAAPFGHLATLGVLLWAIGVAFESIGDAQLARFKRDPVNAGKVMDRGLWRYTRHPNYFGDFLVWWGVWTVSISVAPWWTAVGPALMSFLLLRVSGVKLLESSLKERRPAYREYMERTSAFFPWPPSANETTRSS